MSAQFWAYPSIGDSLAVNGQLLEGTKNKGYDGTKIQEFTTKTLADSSTGIKIRQPAELKKLCEQLLSQPEKYSIAIVTFSRHPAAVTAVLKQLLNEEQIEKINIISGSRTENSLGKMEHIQIAMKKEEIEQLKDVLLIDDDCRNIKLAKQYNVAAIDVVEGKFQWSQVLSKLESMAESITREENEVVKKVADSVICTAELDQSVQEEPDAKKIKRNVDFSQSSADEQKKSTAHEDELKAWEQKQEEQLMEKAPLVIGPSWDGHSDTEQVRQNVESDHMISDSGYNLLPHTTSCIRESCDLIGGSSYENVE